MCLLLMPVLHINGVAAHLMLHGFIQYRRNRLLSACAYDSGSKEVCAQQKNMHLTRSMCLIKRLKRGRRDMRKEHAYGRKAYNGRREANRELTSRNLSSSGYLQPSVFDQITDFCQSGGFWGVCA